MVLLLVSVLGWKRGLVGYPGKQVYVPWFGAPRIARTSLTGWGTVPSLEGTPAKKLYVYVPCSFMSSNIQDKKRQFGAFWFSAPLLEELSLLKIVESRLLLSIFPKSDQSIWGPNVAKTFARYRGHLGTSGPKLEKESRNEFPVPLGPAAQKGKHGVEKESK